MTKALVLVALGLLAGCSGDDNGPASAASESTPVIDNQTLLDDSSQCPAPAFDFAEQLFTESDRQWFCSVATALSDTEDEIYVSRNGQAMSLRFGSVYWNRSLADDSLNVASPNISPMVVRNIFSANTVLTFDLIDNTGEAEAYDCVLVGRETTAPELL